MKDKEYPSVGEVFKLEFDADTPENTPSGMIEVYGGMTSREVNTRFFNFTGTPLTGKCQGRFKLVQIGLQPSMDAAKVVLESQYGPMPSGQWVEVFRKAYGLGQSTYELICVRGGRGSRTPPVGIADDSWIRSHPDDPHPGSHFAALNACIQPIFFPNVEDPTLLGKEWCWIVFVDVSRERVPRMKAAKRRKAKQE